jgi:addiction module HigA family antidote
MFSPPHPGESLKNLYMIPRKMTINHVARCLGVERKAVSRLIHGHTNITARMAIKLSRVFNTTPDIWMNEQATYNLWKVYNDK